MAYNTPNLIAWVREPMTASSDRNRRQMNSAEHPCYPTPSALYARAAMRRCTPPLRSRARLQKPLARRCA